MEQIVVQKIINLSLDCAACDTYQDMEGGAVEDDKGNFSTAKFKCPNCGAINTIKWNIDP